MQPIKIWVVDDDPAYTFLVKMLISESGVATVITTFPDGEQALAEITAHITDEAAIPDIIFLDINMPGINGWDFLSEYEDIADRAPRQPVIYMLTSSIDDSDRQRAKGNPLVTDFICKPLESEKFAEICSSIGDKRS